MTNQAYDDRQIGEQGHRHWSEYAPICIFVIDIAMNPATILVVNQRAEQVYGYSATELLGKPITQLAPGEAVPAILTLLQKVQQGERVKIKTTHQHRDRTRFPVRIIAAPDPTDAGQMIVIVEDITAEKQRRTEAEAIESERRRIAHEFHDGVVQNLAGLRFKLALWSDQADAAPLDMRTRFNELQDVLTNAIIDLRRAIFALRPLNLEAQGFLPALGQLVNDFGDQYQLVARLEVSAQQVVLPAVYELPLFRIIQEGLNNIGQHAFASSVVVSLTMDPAGSVTVMVRDNGCGFDPHQLLPADRDRHFGLRQMRERVLDLGGTLDIHSAPGQGTTLDITLPPVVQEVNDDID